MRYFLLCLLVLVAGLVALALLNNGILDTGDGLNHHFIARYSWQYPHLFLDHWGKPLYTIFSSPFAQAGMTGSVLFNIVVFVATCFLLRDVLCRLEMKHSWLVPVVLLSSPYYFDNIFAGLTETFFAFHVTLVLFFIFRRQWHWAAIAGSFILYSRSEGMLVLLLLGILLLWRRQWKSLPLLGVGYVLFAIAGKLVLNDSWWYFHNDPYQGNSWYGHGPWYHFILGMPLIYGFVALLFAVPGLFLLVDHLLKEKPARSAELVFSIGLFFLYLAAHSALWFFGIKGSLGLLRVMVGVIPLFVLFVFFGASLFRIESAVWKTLTVGLFAGTAILQPFFYRNYPLQPEKEELLYGGAGRWLKHWFAGNKRPDVVTIHHPTIFYYAGLTAFDEQHSPDFWHAPPPFDKIRHGDMIVWDSYFGPNEGEVQLEEIESQPTLQLVRRFVPVAPVVTPRGAPHEVRLYVRGKVTADTVTANEQIFHLEKTVNDKNLFQDFPLANLLQYETSDPFGDYFIEYEVDATVRSRERINAFRIVLASADDSFAPELQLPDSGRSKIMVRIPLPLPEKKYLPLKNFFWMEGSGDIQVHSVTAGLKKRNFRIE